MTFQELKSEEVNITNIDIMKEIRDNNIGLVKRCSKFYKYSRDDIMYALQHNNLQMAKQIFECIITNSIENSEKFPENWDIITNLFKNVNL